MISTASKWFPLSNIDIAFGSMSYAFEGDTLSVLLHGERKLRIRFADVVAIRFENECPGFDPLPPDLPRLDQRWTFPLLQIEGSEWLAQFDGIYQGRSHFALISSDHMLQVISGGEVFAQWESHGGA